MRTYKLIKTAILVFVIAVALVVTVMGCGALYYYHHPDRIRPFLARCLSQATNTSVSIKDLSFSMSPVKIEVRGLVLLPGKDQQGFKFKAGSMEISLGLEGAFGQKELVTRSIRINGWDVELSENMRLPDISRHASSSDFLKKVFSYLLFRKVRLDNAELVNGRILFRTNTGRIRVDDISATLGDSDMLHIRCHMNAHLKNSGASLTADGGMHCRVAVKKERDGKKAFYHEIDMGINDMDSLLSGGGATIKGRIAGDIIMELRYPSLNTKNIALQIKDTVIVSGKQKMDIGAIYLDSASSICDLAKKTFNCPKIHIDSDLIKNLDMAVDVDDKEVSVKIHGSGMGLLKSAASLNLVPPSWTVAGSDSMDIRGVMTHGSGWRFSCGVGFDRLRFSSRDESVMGEGLRLEAAFKGTFDPDRLLVQSSVQMNIPEGEVLYDPFYLDLASNRFSARGDISYNVAKETINLKNFTLGLKDIVKSDIEGAIKPENGALSLAVKLPETPLSPLFKFFALDPFGEAVPSLDRIDLAGLVSSSFALERGEEGIEIKGRCFLHDGAIIFGNGPVSLKDIQCDLPIWCRYPAEKGKKDPSADIRGNLSFKAAYPPWIPFQAVSIPIHSRVNGFYVDSPLRVDIPGGHIIIKRLDLKEMSSAQGPFIETGLFVDVKDTGPLMNDILHMPIKGSIRGKLDPVYIKNDLLKSSGSILARVFGGEIDISDIRCRGIFSGVPVFSLSAELRDLNLGQMTRGTSFGKIEGILTGYVKGLEIAYGQPQSFDLMLESKRVRGVPQRISIAAVDNIARIGGGQSPFMGLAGSLAGAFKTLPYSRMGIRAVLKNDLFRINGIIKEDNVEYIIKRGGLFGVNIVNQNPDNRISFKDMVKRIKRISAPRDEKGGDR